MGKFMKDDILYVWRINKGRCVSNKHYPLYDIPKELDIDFRSNRVLNEHNIYKIWPIIKNT